MKTIILICLLMIGCSTTEKESREDGLKPLFSSIDREII